MTIVDQIIAVFDQRGGEAYLGEKVSMRDHMLQAASNAERSGASNEVVVAALLHDIGHLVNGVADEQRGDPGELEQVDFAHEEAGAQWLSAGFGPAVTEPVRLHVAAKRYLCAVEPTYFAALSPASVHTLGLQGGPMDAGEVAAFAVGPHADATVALRRFDDAGKREGDHTPDLDHFLPLLHATSTTTPPSEVLR
ncbi:MAG: HD domain-containing protein [Ilumatobacteraceae bacterium]|nr:HD domain-containing protein [Ilumatobacteraceae bacterium]